MPSSEKINTPELIISVLYLLWCIILPWSIAGMQIILAMLVLASIIVSIVQKRSPIILHPFYIFLGLYLLANVITLLSVKDWIKSFQGSIQNNWIILTVPFICSLGLSAKWRKYAFHALFLSAALVGIYGVIQFFTGYDFIRQRTLAKVIDFYRAGGGYGAPLSYAGNQLMAFAGVYAFFLMSSGNKKDQARFIIYALIILLSMIATQTRGTMLALPLIILIGVFLIYKKRLYHVLSIVVIFLVVVTVFIPDLRTRVFDTFVPRANETRLNLWKSSLTIIADHPLGIGYGNFNDYLEIYREPGYYTAGGHAHNDYINVAVTNGLPGLITWLSIWISWLYFAIHAYKRVNGDENDKRIILGAILAVIGILFAAIFQCYYTDLENNIFWWFMATVVIQIDIRERSLGPR